MRSWEGVLWQKRMPRLGRVRGRSLLRQTREQVAKRRTSTLCMWVSAKTDMGNGLSQSLALLVCCHIKEETLGFSRINHQTDGPPVHALTLCSTCMLKWPHNTANGFGWSMVDSYRKLCHISRLSLLFKSSTSLLKKKDFKFIRSRKLSDELHRNEKQMYWLVLHFSNIMMNV